MIPLSFAAKKLVGVLLLPPVLPLLIIAIGLLLSLRHRRSGIALAWAGVLCGVLLCLPASVTPLANSLETDPVISAAELAQAQAIVILGGGRRATAPEFGGETVSRITLERIRYGARLARQTGLPVLVTGGAPSRGIAEGELMRRTLVEDFGITPRWVESASLDTRGNAVLSAQLLRSAGVRRVALVTHAMHMRRSVTEFSRAGFTVFPAPTGHLSSRNGSEEVLPGMPAMSTAFAAWYALHEWMGVLAQHFSQLADRA